MNKNTSTPGLDLSYIQTTVNYTVVANTAVFAYVKAGEALHTFDPMAATHAKGLQAAGVKVGYYYYIHVEDDPQASANWFKQCLARLPAPDLLYALDLEANAPNLSPIVVNQWMENFIAALALPVMIYTGPGFANANLPANHNLGRFKLWLAEYNNQDTPTLFCTGFPTVDVWQYSGSGAFNGVTGPVDLDCCDVLPVLPVLA